VQEHDAALPKRRPDLVGSFGLTERLGPQLLLASTGPDGRPDPPASSPPPNSSGGWSGPASPSSTTACCGRPASACRSAGHSARLRAP